MIILGIETTSARGSVALVKDGAVIAEYTLAQSLRYSRHIIPAIHKILTDTGYDLTYVDRIAAGIGPGSFTGIRVGMAIVKGLITQSAIKPVGVSSLLNIAFNSSASTATACVYAQNDEFFMQKFVASEAGEYRTQNECSIVSVEKLFKECEGGVLCSPDLERLNVSNEQSEIMKHVYPTGSAAALIAGSLSEEECCSKQFMPLYIRRGEAEFNGPKVFKL